MHPTLQFVERYEELLQRHTDNSPYDYQSMFPTGGFFVRRRSQKKLAFLKRLDEPLRAMLSPTERVLYLSSGSIHSAVESFLFGAWSYYLNRRALILTTERLILLQIDSRNRPGELRSQVPLESVAKLGVTAFGNTKIQVTSGKSYVLTYVPRADRKALKDRIAAAQAGARARTEAGDMQQLCPYCFRVVSGHPDRCPDCQGGLKSARRAALLSLALPGLGSFYLGHLRFGAVEMLLAASVWLRFAIDIDVRHIPTASIVIAALFIVGVGHGIVALGTYLRARNNLYPAGRQRASAVPAPSIGS